MTVARVRGRAGRLVSRLVWSVLVLAALAVWALAIVGAVHVFRLL